MREFYSSQRNVSLFITVKMAAGDHYQLKERQNWTTKPYRWPSTIANRYSPMEVNLITIGTCLTAYLHT